MADLRNLGVSNPPGVPAIHRAPSGRRTWGMIQPGNIDLTQRPTYTNPDGSVSTVRSIGINVDGQEVLVPGVDKFGLIEPERAEKIYRQTGKHLGIFTTPQASDAYAQVLHNDYEQGRIPGYAASATPAPVMPRPSNVVEQRKARQRADAERIVRQ